MKKFLILLISLLLILTACSSHQSDNNKLRIGLNDEYQPFEYRDENNNLVGFDIELIKALAQKLNKNYEIETLDWEAVFDGLKDHEYDLVISSVSKTDEREKDYALSEPYMANGLVLMTLASNPDKKETYEQLSGKKVGVIKGTSGANAADILHDSKGKEVSVLEYDDDHSILNALKNKEIDYIMNDVGIAAYWLTQEPNMYQVTSKEVLSNEPLVIVADSTNKELIEQVNKALDELRADGFLKNLSEKYFGSDWSTNIDSQYRPVS